MWIFISDIYFSKILVNFNNLACLSIFLKVLICFEVCKREDLTPLIHCFQLNFNDKSKRINDYENDFSFLLGLIS